MKKELEWFNIIKIVTAPRDLEQKNQKNQRKWDGSGYYCTKPARSSIEGAIPH
jgi:hypothetical protein